MMLAALAASVALQFDSLTLHMPVTTDADTVPKTLVYRFRNVGKGPLLITEAQSDCSCTQVLYYPKKQVAADRRDSIVVRFHPRRVAGIIQERVRVSYQAGQEQTVDLTLEGEVLASKAMRWFHLPVRMGDLLMKRRKVTTDGTEVVRILCANVGKTPIALRSKSVPYIQLRTEPATLQPDREGDIVITFLRDKMPKQRPLRSTIELIGYGTIEITIKPEEQ